MNRNSMLIGIAAIAAALGGGIYLGRSTAPSTPVENAAAPVVRKPLYYRNPMGLPDTSPVPKKDEMGMDYIPVYADDATTAAPGTVVISPEKIQTLGVRTEAARMQALDLDILASGTISVDETKQHVIAPRFDGWIETLQANQTGMAIKRGQTLATVYSPQLMAAQEDYRVADAALRQLKKSDTASQQAMKRLRDAAKRRLLNWNITEAQLEHIAHLPPGNLAITAPSNGVILEKAAVEGARFVAGEVLLRLVDLSSVWITVNIPAMQISRVKDGQTAVFTTPALPGRSFEGTLSFLQPTLDTATRTLAVRIVLANADGQLRPGLFGSVALAEPSKVPVLTIPRSALIDSGERQIALVQVAEGRFAPRQLVVGQRSNDRIEVLKGLNEGEQVVVEGNFLIDAESNLRSALADMAKPASTGHEGHDMSGHDMSGHTMPEQTPTHAPIPASAQSKPAQKSADPHAGHDMGGNATPAAPKADPHAGHDMSQMEH